MRINTYRRNLTLFLFTLFIILFFFLAEATAWPTLAANGVDGGVDDTTGSGTAAATCEVYPGYFITCPQGTTCGTISRQQRCVPDSYITPSPVQQAPTQIVVQPTSAPTAVIVIDNCHRPSGDANCDFSI